MELENRKNTMVIGKNPILEALKNKANIDKIFIHQTLRGPFEIELRQLCKNGTIPLIKVPEQKLNRMNSGNHQGVVAFITPVKIYQLSEIIPWVYEQGRNPFILILDGVTDVGNFGAIARSALAFGVDAMVLSTKRSVSLSADAIKASSGALLKLPICRCPTVIDGVKYIQNQGLTVFASSLKANESLATQKFNVPKAVVIGAEDRGVSREVLELSNKQFKIPQSEKMESLNVSVATGIILHHCYVNHKD